MKGVGRVHSLHTDPGVDPTLRGQAARLYIVLYGKLMKTVESDGTGLRGRGCGSISATQASASEADAPLEADIILIPCLMQS